MSRDLDPSERPQAAPAPGVHAVTAARLAGLRHWAAGAGQRWVDVPLAPGASRHDALLAIGRTLAFPGHYGANLDALYDCLTDLPDRDAAAGWVIHLAGFAAAGLAQAERAALLDVFAAAAEAFAARGRALRVLHD